jgi:hypothetical protein
VTNHPGWHLQSQDIQELKIPHDFAGKHLVKGRGRAPRKSWTSKMSLEGLCVIHGRKTSFLPVKHKKKHFLPVKSRNKQWDFHGFSPVLK